MSATEQLIDGHNVDTTRIFATAWILRPYGHREHDVVDALTVLLREALERGGHDVVTDLRGFDALRGPSDDLDVALDGLADGTARRSET